MSKICQNVQKMSEKSPKNVYKMSKKCQYWVKM